MGIDNPVHLLFIAAVALVVLGPKRLPELARSLGKGIREFRESISDGSLTGAPHVPTAQNPPVAPTDATVVAPPPVAPEPPQVAYPPQNPTGAPEDDAVVSSSPQPAAASETPADATVVAPPPPSQVDPPEPVRSGDHAPDSRPL